MREQYTQYPEKMIVWAGSLGNNIIGPFFRPGNLTGEFYLNLLEEFIYPCIVDNLENEIFLKMI